MTKKAAILDFELDVPAKTVVKDLKRRGIAVSESHVHTARSNARKALKAEAAPVQGSNGHAAPRIVEFRKMVLDLGVDLATAEVGRMRTGLAALLQE